MPHIYETPKSPNEVYKDVEHGTMIAIKKINKESIILAYMEDAEVVKIMTLCYSTELDSFAKSP